MFIVVEGPDLSGKSTLAKSLSKVNNFRLVKWPYTKHILEKCPDESGETFYRTLQQFKDLDVVMDRGFISNFVYDKLLNRQYDNSYIYEVVKDLDPHFIVLKPTIELLEERSRSRAETFIKDHQWSMLLSLYDKAANEFSKRGWNVSVVDVKSNEHNLSFAANFAMNSRSYRQQIKRDVENNGKVVEVFSAHHDKHLSTKELLFLSTLECSFQNEHAEFDADYAHILDRLRDVIALLKKEPTHRGAVILNSKAESGECICLWQFLVRDSTLFTSVYIRSSDLHRKLIQDVQMTRWLAQEVSRGLGVQVGPLYIVQGSAHYYL